MDVNDVSNQMKFLFASQIASNSIENFHFLARYFRTGLSTAVSGFFDII